MLDVEHQYSFFCFKQKTAYEMRIRDWSSDVCSSDLLLGLAAQADDRQFAELVAQRLGRPRDVAVDLGGDLVLAQRGVVAQVGQRLLAGPALGVHAGKNGRESCREREIQSG